ncbi:MAG: acyl carrier protein [Burkholderiales bacterium]
MSQPYPLLPAICEAVNQVKRTGYSADGVTDATFLGGDLGVDSIEMLEIWFTLEKRFDIKIPDLDKRDIYTLGDAVQVLERHLSPHADQGALAETDA